MLTTFPQCNCSLEFPEILSQNHIRYHWLSVSGISKIMHCGILISIPYWIVWIFVFFQNASWDWNHKKVPVHGATTPWIKQGHRKRQYTKWIDKKCSIIFDQRINENLIYTLSDISNHRCHSLTDTSNECSRSFLQSIVRQIHQIWQSSLKTSHHPSRVK